MNGMELLRGMSYVDERFIAEAETEQYRKGNLTWTRGISMAACLCLLVAGVFAYRQTQGKDAASYETEAPAAEAPGEQANQSLAMPEVADGAPLMPEPAADEAQGAPKAPTDEPQQIPYACLSVKEILEEGSFLAEITELSQEPTPLEVGMEVTVVVDPAKVPGADAQVQNDLKGVPENARIEIRDGAYDAEQNVLYVAQVKYLSREGQ